MKSEGVKELVEFYNVLFEERKRLSDLIQKIPSKKVYEKRDEIFNTIYDYSVQVDHILWAIGIYFRDNLPENYKHTCCYSPAWSSCNIPVKFENDKCIKHKDIKCKHCNKLAVKECNHCGQFVCGTPLCKDCHCH